MTYAEDFGWNRAEYCCITSSMSTESRYLQVKHHNNYMLCYKLTYYNRAYVHCEYKTALFVFAITWSNHSRHNWHTDNVGQWWWVVCRGLNRKNVIWQKRCFSQIKLVKYARFVKVTVCFVLAASWQTTFDVYDINWGKQHQFRISLCPSISLSG